MYAKNQGTHSYMSIVIRYLIVGSENRYLFQFRQKKKADKVNANIGIVGLTALFNELICEHIFVCPHSLRMLCSTIANRQRKVPAHLLLLLVVCHFVN